MKKLFTIMVFTVFMLLSTINAFAMIENNIEIYIDNVKLEIPEEYGKPLIDDTNRTQIPLRVVSEKLGANVEWQNETWTAVLNDDIVVKIGSDTITKQDGSIVKMDTKAFLKDGRTFVPLRFVSEILGFSVDYNKIQGIHRIDITSPIVEEEAPQEETVDEEGKFINNPALKTSMKKYDKGKYLIKKNAFYYDDNEYLGSNSSIRGLFFPLKKEYEFRVLNFQSEHRNVLKDLLVAELGQDLGEHIYSQFQKGWDSKGKDIVDNTWLEYKENQYCFISDDDAGIEILVK